jgi:CCR4-NOT transcriptional regulation complex NOT5 subunit
MHRYDEQEDIVLCKIYRKAVSLKELEQRVAMEELARASASASASATPSASHNTGSPADSMSSSDQQGETTTTTTMMMMGGVAIPPPATVCMKKEVVTTEPTAAVLRPETLSLPQLEVAKQQQEWMQDPFLTQLRSPWMESWSPYYASVLNF